MQPMRFDFSSRRSMVTARRGMVAASNPLAAQAGLAILRAGGNAADAAIATAAVLNVTAPASTGIGGDCFALYYDAATGAVSALNGSGRAPAALTCDHLVEQGFDAVPPHSAHAVTVPGAVRGWHDLLVRHGTMTLAETLVDAIHYAANGFPVSPVFASAWNIPETVTLLRQSRYAGDYLPDGKPPCPGQIVRLPDLANTLRAIADGGPDAFYTGPVAAAIVDTLGAIGGVMSLDDLSMHHSTWGEPIQATYRGVTVCEHPPNGQGLAALLALNIAQGWDIGAMPWDDPARLHLLIEAMRLAFADARRYITDPATSAVPVDALLQSEYASQRRALVTAGRAMQPPTFGMPPSSSDTVYLATVDSDGNACSFINSLYMGFGSGIVARGTGVFLQNRGANFTLQADHPNVLAAGKRPYHTIIPGMLLRDGALWGPFGVMGGFMQPQGHLQVVSALVDDALNPQEALDRPRFCLLGGDPGGVIALEDGVPVSTMAQLAAWGHPVRPIAGQDRSVFGSGQIILRDPDSGVLFGGSDPRKDGLVAAW